MSDKVRKFLESLGSLAEISVCYYNMLVERGMEKEIAADLTNKLIGQFIKGTEEHNEK